MQPSTTRPATHEDAALRDSVSLTHAGLAQTLQQHHNTMQAQAPSSPPSSIPFSSQPVRLADHFPAVKPECKDKAAKFFYCFENNSYHVCITPTTPPAHQHTHMFETYTTILNCIFCFIY